MTAQVNSDLTYAITNVKAGTVMDLSTADNCSIIGWLANGGLNHKWTMIWMGNAPRNFVSKAMENYLTITGGAGDNTLLTASAAPFDWDIWRADDDPFG